MLTLATEALFIKIPYVETQVCCVELTGYSLSEEGSLILKLDIFSVHVLNYLGKPQKKHESPHFPYHKSHIKKKAGFDAKRDLLAASGSIVADVSRMHRERIPSLLFHHPGSPTVLEDRSAKDSSTVFLLLSNGSFGDQVCESWGVPFYSVFLCGLL